MIPKRGNRTHVIASKIPFPLLRRLEATPRIADQHLGKRIAQRNGLSNLASATDSI